MSLKRIQKRLPENTTFDRIYKYYIEGSDFPLDEKDEKIRQRWETAWSLLLNYHSKEQAAPILMEKFEISRATVYRDIQNSLELFGDVTQSSKEGYRHILTEYSMKTFQLAAKAGDYDAMNKAINTIVKLQRLDQIDPEQIDPSELLQKEYKLNLHKDALDIIKGIASQGKVDLTRIFKPDQDAIIIEDEEEVSDE